MTRFKIKCTAAPKPAAKHSKGNTVVAKQVSKMLAGEWFEFPAANSSSSLYRKVFAAANTYHKHKYSLYATREGYYCLKVLTAREIQEEITCHQR